MNVQLILLKNVDKLGQAGEVKSVKRGYAVNLLIPKGLAEIASEQKIKQMQENKVKIEAKKKKAQEKLEKLFDKIDEATVKMKEKADEEGHLYGSVSAKEVVKALKKKIGIKLNPKLLDMKSKISKLGEHSVSIKISENKMAKIKVTVVKEE